MKIVFGADFHSSRMAFSAFCRALSWADVGVLGGDLLDEFIGRQDAEELGLIPPDEPEELLGAEEDVAEVFERAFHDALNNAQSVNRRGLKMVQESILAELNSVGKPVFLIPGNHDRSPWPSLGNVENIEGRRVDFGGWNFVGFDHTGFRHSDRSRAQRLRWLKPLVDGKTIFITHSPPWGTLDRTSTENIGSRAVGRFVRRTTPAWVLCGHVHEATGREERVVNAAWFLSRRFALIDTEASTVDWVTGEAVV